MIEIDNLQKNQDSLKKGPHVLMLMLQVFLLSVLAFYTSLWFSFSIVGTNFIVRVILWPLSLSLHPLAILFIMVLATVIFFVRWLFFSIASIKRSLVQKKILSVKTMLSIVLILFLSILFFVSTWYCAAGIVSPVF